MSVIWAMELVDVKGSKQPKKDRNRQFLEPSQTESLEDHVEMHHHTGIPLHLLLFLMSILNFSIVLSILLYAEVGFNSENSSNLGFLLF